METLRMHRDFYLDDCRWTIRDMVVNGQHWLRGRKAPIHPEWIKRVSWDNSTVFVDLSQKSVKKGPAIDPSTPVSRDDESRLFGHYKRPKSWVVQVPHTARVYKRWGTTRGRQMAPPTAKQRKES
jgi:hypothetical protein